MKKFNLAVVVGSNRQNSINRRLAEALVKLGADKFSSHFVRVDDLPMYNQDLEPELPDTVKRLKSDIESADGLLVVTPEHNRSIPAVLKNAIDWGARPFGRNSWFGKPVAITGASPGAVGTGIAQQHLRQVLGSLGGLVMGGEAYISFKPGLIDETGAVSDDGTQTFLRSYLEQFAGLLVRLSPSDRERAAAA